MEFDLCRHIRTNGRRCQSPTVNSKSWCFFHEHLHRRHHAFRPTEATRAYLVPGQHIELTALEDRESVQVALSVVINALATGNLDARRATAILYGLQLASNNAATINTQPIASAVVRTTETDPEGLALAEPATGQILDYDPQQDDEQDDDVDDDVYDA